jgi:hypothetical protein
LTPEIVKSQPISFVVLFSELFHVRVVRAMVLFWPARHYYESQSTLGQI